MKSYIDQMKDLIDLYLESTKEFSAILRERTPTEVAYDREITEGLRQGLSIEKSLERARKKYPAESLQWGDQTIRDIANHYESLKDHEDILAKLKPLFKEEKGSY